MITAALSITISSCIAQIKNAKTETVKVYGNCETCKKKIETAANKKHISKAVWSIDNKTAVLTYDSTKTNADAILKQIALAGYDNQNYMAPDNAYSSLDMCCQYDRKKSSQVKQSGGDSNMNMHHDMSNMQPQDTAKKVSENTKVENPLNAVYTAYFALKDALTKDDGSTAAAKAKELFKAIDAVPMEKLNSSQHTVWMKYQKQLSYDAEHIKGVTENEHQREHFISLSKNMFEVMKVIKYDATVYYDFCPMANDGKGATWLSLQQPIANPYMGKSMPTCGKVQDTITK